MVQRDAADLEREAQELAQTLDRRAGRLPEEFIAALKGRADELLLQAATLRYETEKSTHGGAPVRRSGGL